MAMQKRLSDKYSTEVSRYRRIYRDLSKIKVLRTSEVNANTVLQRSIQQTSTQLDRLNNLIGNIDNKLIRSQGVQFAKRITSLVSQAENYEHEIGQTRTKIEHLKSQINRVDVRLEKYSTLDDRFSADKRIQVLEDTILHRNQKVNLMKVEGLRMKAVVSDLIVLRREFQAARDRFIAKLMAKKKQILELVDGYSIAFANDMKNCQNLEKCRLKSVAQLKEHLQEMRQLIRAAESNDILREFMITKATPIKLQSEAVPERNILKANYKGLIEENEQLRQQIDEYAPNVKAYDIREKVRETFALYLYSNDITKIIDDAEKTLTALAKGTAEARVLVKEREGNKGNMDGLESQWNDEAAETQRNNDGLAQNEAMLKKYYENIGELFQVLQCEDSLLYEAGKEVHAFNVDGVLRVIEAKLRHVMHTVLCWEEEKEIREDKRLVHGVEFVKAKPMPKLDLVHPCPECSQIEARAIPDVEKVLDDGAKYEKIKEGIQGRNLKAKMHNIEECPKPGSKAVVSKMM